MSPAAISQSQCHQKFNSFPQCPLDPHVIDTNSSPQCHQVTYEGWVEFSMAFRKFILHADSFPCLYIRITKLALLPKVPKAVVSIKIPVKIEKPLRLKCYQLVCDVYNYLWLLHYLYGTIKLLIKLNCQYREKTTSYLSYIEIFSPSMTMYVHRPSLT